MPVDCDCLGLINPPVSQAPDVQSTALIGRTAEQLEVSGANILAHLAVFART
jgi:hypothetical protein